MNKNGFTLIELMIVVAMVTIVTSIALPNLIKVLDNEKLQSSVMSFQSNFNLAKMSAMRHRTNIVINFTAKGDGYTLALKNPGGVTSDTLPVTVSLDKPITITDFKTIEFDSRGYPISDYAFKIKSEDKKKEIEISRTGTVNVK